MNSLQVYKVIIFTSLCVIFLVNLNAEAGHTAYRMKQPGKLPARQSLSQLARDKIRKKDGDISSKKNHFQSKLVIMCAIGDYEVEFMKPAAREEPISIAQAKKNIQTIVNVDVTNNTADGKACRKDILERKLKWKYYLENPPSERIAKLKSRIEKANDQFTLEEFCQAVAILYQRIKDDLDLELRNLAKSDDNPISKYSRTNFVIPFLLEDYPGEIGKLTEELIAKELQISH